MANFFLQNEINILVPNSQIVPKVMATFIRNEHANYYKNKDPDYVNFVADINEHEKQELLDALCDQIVTAVGVAHMLGMDIEGALNEVNNSNWSKFEDGEPVFNEQGKIAKGRDYFAPDLTRFIGSTNK